MAATASGRTVLISGAGIAGAGLAYWLRRYGLIPTVVERAPGIRPGGQPVDLRGAGRTVVERMGLLDAARAVRTEESGMATVDAGGRRLMTMAADVFGPDGPVAEIEVHRGDLVDLLYGASRDHVEYVFGDHVTGLVSHDDGVGVTFARGPARTFSLVVGADGLHSAVRALAFGEEARFLRPLGGYMSFFTVPDPRPADDRSWFLTHATPGGRSAGLRPAGAGNAKALLTFRSEPLRIDPRDVAAQKAVLAGRFAGMAWEVPRILAGMEEATDFFFDAIGQVHMDACSTGRVVLLGDAGYCASPLTGMGTSLALVGAYVLAGELGRAEGADEGADDPAVAFARYEQVMRPYIAQCQKLPPGGLAMMAPRTAWAIRAGVLLGRLMTTRPLRRVVARTMFSTADTITLPDYRRSELPSVP